MVNTAWGATEVHQISAKGQQESAEASAKLTEISAKALAKAIPTSLQVPGPKCRANSFQDWLHKSNIRIQLCVKMYTDFIHETRSKRVPKLPCFIALYGLMVGSPSRAVADVGAQTPNGKPRMGDPQIIQGIGNVGGGNQWCLGYH